MRRREGKERMCNRLVPLLVPVSVPVLVPGMMSRQVPAEVPLSVPFLMDRKAIAVQPPHDLRLHLSDQYPVACRDSLWPTLLG